MYGLHDFILLKVSDIEQIFNLIQAANPTYTEGKIIDEPSIESHLKDEDMLPAMNLPGRRYITSFDPSTGLHLGTFIADTEAEIGSKIDRVALAQKSWKKTTMQQRRRVIRSLLKWLVDNQDACARVACRDTGKTCKIYFPCQSPPGFFDRCFVCLFSN